MSETEQPNEENVARLVRIGYSLEARPSEAARTRALSALMAEARSRAATPPFPSAAAVLLGAFIVTVGIWLAIGTAEGVTHPALALVAGMVALNLALAPAAGAAIVLYRRHHA